MNNNEIKTPQDEIVYANVCNMLVSAGAGCGKSTTMTRKIIYRLEECGFSLKNIIILTFTNASRDDIQKKVRDALKKKMDNAKSFEEKERWLKEYEYVDQANICTFDAFMQGLFKKYAYKLGISSNVNIVDQTLSSYIKANMLTQIIDDMVDDCDVKKLLKKYTIRHQDELVENILNFYKRVVDNFVDVDKKLDEIKNNYFDLKDTCINYYKSKALLSVKKIIDEYNNMDYQGRDIVEPIINCFFDNPSYDKLYRIDFSSIKLPSANKKEFKKDNNPDNALALKAMRDEINFLKKYLVDPEELEIKYDEQYEDICGLVKISKILYKQNIEYSMKYSTYTYNDIARLVIKILKENEDVLLDIKSNTLEIYVDEYQDTSDIQEEMISLISNENAFMVGDIKQSIYRFRSANPDIFQNKYNKYLNNDGGVLKILDTNYRSRVQVLEELNRMFDPLMSLDFDGINYKAEHRLNAGHKDFTSDDPGFEFHSVDSICFTETEEKMKAFEMRTKVFEDVLNDIEYKIKHGKKMDTKGNISSLDYGDFCILTRNKTRFNTYSEMAKERNIPLECEQANPFISNLDIIAITSILKLVYNPDDRAALAALQKSFVYRNSEKEVFELAMYLKDIKKEYKKNDFNKYVELRDNSHECFQIVKKINAERKTKTLYDLILAIYKEFNIFDAIKYLTDSKGAEARLIYLLDVSKTFIALEKDVEEFLEYLGELSKPRQIELDIEYQEQNPKRENAIHLMTIHKSKGLEFPFVYIIETESKCGKVDKNLVSYSKNLGVSFNGMETESYLYNSNYEDNRLSQLYEDLRMLYVAVTRAKQKVIVYVSGIDSDSTKERLTISSKDKEAYKSYNDMLVSVYESVSYAKSKEKEKVKLPDYISPVLNIEFKEIPLKEGEDTSGKVSHSLETLITKERADILRRGTELHEVMEYFDFDNPNYNNMDDKTKNDVKSFIDLVINNKEICKSKPLHYYKEQEFMNNGSSCIIDLLIETLDEFIVVDYKTANIGNPAYDLQVGAYMELVRQKGNKPVKGYLYSLEHHELREIK